MHSELMENAKVIRPAIWKNDARFTAAFSTKAFVDGTSDDTNGFSLALNDSENKHIFKSKQRAWLEYIGLKDIPLSLGKQVHGSEVRMVNDAAFQEDTDGLVTTQRGLALGVLVADCAAVLMADRKAGVIAAVHAGWRGAVDGILDKTIFKMLLAGADVREMEAFVSPCISLSAFEVGEEVARLFPAEFVDYETYEKPHIDLRKFVTQELMKAGLRESNIETNTLCTVNEVDTLHSYRRDKNKSGRMMAVISMC